MSTNIPSPAVRVPVELDLRLSVNGQAVTITPIRASLAPAGAAEGLDGIERAEQPFINTDYTDRIGFDSNFIGVPTPLPSILDMTVVSQMKDGSGHLIPYEHFSVVMHAARRLPLFTASNVSYSPPQKIPEPGRDYSRRGLAGFDESVRGEIWLVDERVPSEHQLDNKFYDADRAAFDKGHVVRREDVCWGDSYDQVRQANGDTFHSTNCTPQRANFNQTNRSGIWGQFEDYIKTQADTELLTLFSGPVLAEDDRVFDGRDTNGPVRIQIPKRFWKIVCANKDGQLQTFGFLLEQTTEDVTEVEFEVNAHWRTKMISLGELEQLVPLLKFSDEFHEADQQ